MSGRPKDPSYTVETFCPDTLYPAGSNSWSSNACKVAPPGQGSVGFTPGGGVCAQHENFLHNAWSTAHTNAKNSLIDLFVFLGNVQPFNIGAEITLTGGVTAYPNGGFFDGYRGRWWACGNSNELRGAWKVTDWDTSTRMTAGTTADNLYSGAVDSATGKMVVTLAGRNAIEYSADDGATWTRVTALGLADAAISETTPRVLWDGASWIYAAGVSGDLIISTSTTGSAWTDAATSATTPGGDHTAIATDGSKVVISSTYTNIVNVSWTDDRGATLHHYTIAHSLTAVDQVSLSWLPESAEFLLTISDTTARKSEIWYSTDATTWTLRLALSTAAIQGDIAVVGNMLVAAMRILPSPLVLDEICYSLNAGATWKTTRQRLTGATKGVYVGDGRLLVVTGTGVWPGLAAGDQGQPVI